MMRALDELLDLAVGHHGSVEAVETRLPTPKSQAELLKLEDDRWLAQFAKEVFAVQFSRPILENKWAAFERAFDHFEPGRVALYSDVDFDRLVADKSIVRNAMKIRATLDNAAFIQELALEYGSAAKFFAEWPQDDIITLWLLMKDRGARLGGATGPRALRNMGKDTFILTGDVVTALIREGVVEREPKTPKTLGAVQTAFNIWADESGRPLCQISRILAMSVG